MTPPTLKERVVRAIHRADGDKRADAALAEVVAWLRESDDDTTNIGHAYTANHIEKAARS
jgi:hypothetical protein